MEIKTIEISKINPSKYNPRKDLQPGDSEYEKLKKSILEFDMVEPLVINKRTGNLISGHQRIKILKELGKTEVESVIVELSETKEKALNLALNKISGEWDSLKLKDILEELDCGQLDDIEITGFDDIEIEDLMTQFYVSEEEQEHIKLTEKFIIPPFSIFDTRKGYWQDRKSAWLSLGIRSEIGRGENLSNFADACAIKFKRNTVLSRQLQANSSLKNVSKLPDYVKGGEGCGMEYIAPNTSMFDPVLCEICYKWFCIDGGNILDPFAGGSVRGIIANYLGYKYIGIDLSKRQIEANIEQSNIILKDKNKPKWIIGNSLNINNLVKDKMDFIFSCPPYFDLEKYSDDSEDLSNLEWGDFKNQYREIISKTVNLLKDDRFACFVVNEIRDKKGIYRNFVDYTKYCFLDAGMEFYNDIVLINVAGSLPIRVNKIFSSGRKVGKMHQNVLVFYKGNIKKIKENYKEINIKDLKKYEKTEI